MLIPKADRLMIYRYLFKEGVLCAHKNLAQPKHHILDTRNLYVCKALQSLKSRGYVTEQFAWQWHYWFLTNEGIEYLRGFLHLPEEIVPSTLKKPRQQARPAGFGGDRAGPRGAGRGTGRGGYGDRGGYGSRDRSGGGFGGDKKGGAPSRGEIGFRRG